MHRTASNETTLVSEIPNIINEENVIIVSILSYEFCEKQSFPYLLPNVKFGFNAPQDIPINQDWYFNQSLLNFNQYFASDADYIFFC